MDKIKAIDPKIVVNGNADKPYYSIEYYDTSDNKWHIGYGSYELRNVIEWLKTCFDVVEADVEPVRHGHWVEEDTAITCPICTRSYDTDFEIKRSVVLRFKYCPECGAKMDGKDGDKNAKL
ncbi:MAG: hypothetical protein MRZ61_05530 [Oscillospiraceae bacterium]|nr:hypothetical protein [Oscillospiraceae bacterium]